MTAPHNFIKVIAVAYGLSAVDEFTEFSCNVIRRAVWIVIGKQNKALSPAEKERISQPFIDEWERIYKPNDGLPGEAWLVREGVGSALMRDFQRKMFEAVLFGSTAEQQEVKLEISKYEMQQ